jgi:hypothetical protein
MADPTDPKAKGTNGDDHLNPQGNGTIETGTGQDTVVLSEGDFFHINGFQDRDNGIFSVSMLEKANQLRSLMGKEELEIKEDRLLMFIEPEKEAVQQVQYFVEGGTTYVQVFDKEQDKVVSAARVNGTGFKIEVVGENGSLGVAPTLLEGDTQNAASNIRNLIAYGEFGEDRSLTSAMQEIASDYLENTLDEIRGNPVLNHLIEQSTKSRTP